MAILCNTCMKPLTEEEASVYDVMWQHSGDMYCMKHRDCPDDCRRVPCLLVEAKMSIYELLLARKTLRVQFKKPGEDGRYTKPFIVQPLLMMGEDYHTSLSSEWARFARVGGIVINSTRRGQMDREEMKAWCEGVELLEIIRERKNPQHEEEKP